MVIKNILKPKDSVMAQMMCPQYPNAHDLDCWIVIDKYKDFLALVDKPLEECNKYGK